MVPMGAPSTNQFRQFWHISHNNLSCLLISYFKSAFENDDTEDIFYDGILECNIEFGDFVIGGPPIDVESRIKGANIWKN